MLDPGPAILRHGKRYTAPPPKPTPGLICDCSRCDARLITTGREKEFSHFIQEYQYAIYVDAWSIPCPECSEPNSFVSPYPDEKDLPAYKTKAIYTIEPGWKIFLRRLGFKI